MNAAVSTAERIMTKLICAPTRFYEDGLTMCAVTVTCQATTSSIVSL